MTDRIEEEGQLKGSFKGFHNRETVFQFYGGGTWRQNEYRYHYHYAYMPRARVINRDGRTLLEVDGIADTVEVRRVR
jgi:hypothetical protein